MTNTDNNLAKSCISCNCPINIGPNSIPNRNTHKRLREFSTVIRPNISSTQRYSQNAIPEVAEVRDGLRDALLVAHVAQEVEHVHAQESVHEGLSRDFSEAETSGHGRAQLYDLLLGM